MCCVMFDVFDVWYVKAQVIKNFIRREYRRDDDEPSDDDIDVDSEDADLLSSDDEG